MAHNGTMERVLDNYVGAMLGVAIGDALGAPYETMSAKRVAAELENKKLDYVAFVDPFNKDVTIPAGSVTDDTEMSFALAQSLIQGGFDIESQYQAYRKLVQSDAVSPLTGGRLYGFGGLTKSALSALTLSESMSDPNVPIRASNGALMRTAPIALLTAMTINLFQSFQLAQDATGVTHRSKLAAEISGVYTVILAGLLRGYSPSSAIDLAQGVLPRCVNGGLIHEFLSAPWRDIGLMRGAALESFRVAIDVLTLAGRDGCSFESGIEYVIGKGGDTDTNAAIAGALLGAHFGANEIGEHLKAGLHGRTRELMEVAGRELFKIAYAAKK